ncbi:transposase [Paenibacillus sp. N4]|uniref:RNA-guided endonuclease InsQ/TnpB family protein n=1 Tax=Paenibacillus vietnamensis TaxID=2590547 RepID=UPI001CD07E3B|nr:RNA-guided endonuclease TnpB family protein [Paenibacillus vietnamensis]MCA0756292.1 transposase [Paenibacillus vietnamensis]
MIVTVTAKIKIMPTDRQIEALHQTMLAYRQGCNLVSGVVFNSSELKQTALHRMTYQILRSTFGLRSQMAQSVMKTVIARYKTIRSNGHEWTCVQFKKPEYDLVWNRDYSLNAQLFSVNTLQGRIKVPFVAKGMEAYFDGSWTFGTAKLVWKKRKWFLHIPVSKEIGVPGLKSIEQVAGIDLGINFIATVYGSDGKTVFFRGGELKRKRANYKRLRSELQRKQTPSSRRRLKQIGQRETRWMTHVNHQVSKALVSHFGANTLFVLEDLTGIRGATEKTRLKDRYVTVSWAFHQLRKMVEYKAQLAGSITIAVDPKHTSQECPVCGHTAKENRDKAKHLFRCRDCGYTSNDDRIGAMNLYLKGKQYLLQGAGVA